MLAQRGAITHPVHFPLNDEWMAIGLGIQWPANKSHRNQLLHFRYAEGL